MNPSAAPGEPAISVVVPTHDRRPLLERKLRALEAEAGRCRFEVVVVADGCSDDTEDFLATYQPPYPLRWCATDGKHAAYARQRGAEMASAAVLLFSDDDVIPSPGWLQGNLALHQTASQVGLSRLVLPDHLQVGVTRSSVQGWWSCGGASLSLRSELYHRVDGYDPAFAAYGGEDMDLGYRLLLAGARFVFLPEAAAEHWDEDYLATLEAKGKAAGRAHVKVWRKHDDPRVAWALGVHPLVLALKGLVLRRSLTSLLRHHRYRWEVAYVEGARLAMREGA